MTQKKNEPRTCFDCYHCKACHLWCNSISKTVAPKCQEFEPVRYVTVRDLHDMLLMKKEMDGGAEEK